MELERLRNYLYICSADVFEGGAPQAPFSREGCGLEQMIFDFESQPLPEYLRLAPIFHITSPYSHSCHPWFARSPAIQASSAKIRSRPHSMEQNPPHPPQPQKTKPPPVKKHGTWKPTRLRVIEAFPDHPMVRYVHRPMQNNMKM